MFDDGIISEWDLAKIRKYFNGDYPISHSVAEQLYNELFMPVYTVAFKQALKDHKSNKPTNKKPASKLNTNEPKKPEDKSTKSSNEKYDAEQIDLTKALQKLVDIISDEDTPNDEYKKTTVHKTSSGVKKHSDDKTKISLTGMTETQHAEGDKRMRTITIALTNGKYATWTSDNYDNYKLVDGCFVVIKNGAYVGIYNMKYVTSIVVK